MPSRLPTGQQRVETGAAWFCHEAKDLGWHHLLQRPTGVRQLARPVATDSTRLLPVLVDDAVHISPFAPDLDLEQVHFTRTEVRVGVRVLNIKANLGVGSSNASHDIRSG